ncbi:MAG: lytic murein transglycosylase, partial [Candidatus Electrothrix sp. EH2]|nr:lytic murein transglycosylase [Candidatus Electrothrix sp. EH2]
LDRKQKEYSLSFTNYLNNSISPARIRIGKRKIRENAEIFDRIEKKYAVPPEILVSLWGLESNFGSFTGNFSTINTLATLAYEGRRRDFFTNELLCALAVLDSGHITVQEMTGSWAGAMGQPQFMPSTFLHYAADGNGDGKKDIWKNTSDVLTSAANYLAEAGWKRGQKWGLEVVLPATFDPYQATLSVKKAWRIGDHWG